MVPLKHLSTFWRTHEMPLTVTAIGEEYNVMIDGRDFFLPTH